MQTVSELSHEHVTGTHSSTPYSHDVYRNIAQKLFPNLLKL